MAADDPVLHRCWSCGVHYWITEHLHEHRKGDKGTFFCPNGHGAVFAKSEADKVREELAKVARERDRLKQDAARLEDALATAARSRRALQGQLKSVKTRVGAGVCPCCNRTFQQLARHMSAKHKDYATAKSQEAA